LALGRTVQTAAVEAEQVRAAHRAGMEATELSLILRTVRAAAEQAEHRSEQRRERRVTTAAAAVARSIQGEQAVPALRA